MRSRALTSPFGGAPRRGRATVFISASSSRSDSLLDIVTDLSYFQVTYRYVTLWRMAMRAIEAKTFSGYGGLRQTELPEPQPAKDRGPRHGRRRHTARSYAPVGWTPSGHGAAGARQRGRRCRRGCR